MTGFDSERRAAPLVAAGAALLCAGTAMAHGPWALLAVPGLLLVGLACVSARDGFLLFGPVARYDLRRHFRRHAVHRWTAVVTLTSGAAVVGLFAVATRGGTGPVPQWATQTATVGFLVVGLVLFAGTTLGLVLQLAGVAAEDRRAKWGEFLLLTDLRGRELTTGRALAALAVAVRYPAAVLPLVTALPLLFRVDPAVPLLVIGYAAVTLVSLAGVYTLGHVPAAGRWWLSLVWLVLLIGLCPAFLSSVPAVSAWPGTPSAPAAVSLGDLAGWAAVGNPFPRVYGWVIARGCDLEAAAAGLPGYTAFHLFVGVVSFALAARGVRSAADDGAETAVVAPSRRPSVSDRPVFWKEVHVNPLDTAARPRPWQRWLGRAVVLLPAALLLASTVSDLVGYAEMVRKMGRMLPGYWAMMSGMGAAVLVAQSLPLERERDTLISLLTSPLSREEIARDRLWGTMWRCRWQLPAAGMTAAAAAVAGAFPWTGVPLVLTSQALLMGLGAGIGGLNGAAAPNRKAVASGFTPHGLAAFPLAIAAMATPAVGEASDGQLVCCGVVLLLVLAAYAAYARWLWSEAVRRFVEACDPGRADGPILTGREER